MSLSEFTVLEKIGDGAYSDVFRVRRIADRKVYALKKVKLGKLKEKEKANALNEVRILASINNPFVIQYKDAFFDEKEGWLCLIMEYADGGDLYQKILEHTKKKSLIDEKLIWSVAIGVVNGLKALHELKIFHRDLKSANVFLFKDGRIKLGDLNVSKQAKKGLLLT